MAEMLKQFAPMLGSQLGQSALSGPISEGLGNINPTTIPAVPGFEGSGTTTVTGPEPGLSVDVAGGPLKIPGASTFGISNDAIGKMVGGGLGSLGGMGIGKLMGGSSRGGGADMTSAIAQMAAHRAPVTASPAKTGGRKTVSNDLNSVIGQAADRGLLDDLMRRRLMG